MRKPQSKFTCIVPCLGPCIDALGNPVSTSGAQTAHQDRRATSVDRGKTCEN
jgi:hypothetical protein